MKSVFPPEGFPDDGFEDEGRVTVVLGFLSLSPEGLAAGLDEGAEGRVTVVLFFFLSFDFLFCEAGADLLTCEEADDDRFFVDEERDVD